MDDAKKLIHWAINLGIEHQAEITNFDWPNRYDLSLSDYLFRFKFKEKIYDGRGLASTSELALVKAISEAVERTTLDFYQLKNSNGVAAHFTEEQATENAICELIERDVFLCNYLYLQAGVKLIGSHHLRDDSLKMVKLLESKKIEVAFYELGTTLGRGVILCLANGFKSESPFGCVVGLGANVDKDRAVESALGEVSRNTFTLIDRNICTEWSKSEGDFFCEIESKFSILEHSNLALSREYSKWLWDYYSEKQRYSIVKNSINLDEIQIKSLSLDSKLAGLGLKVMRAESEVLQNLFFHVTNIKKINVARMERYMNASFRYENLNTRTHPLS